MFPPVFIIMRKEIKKIIKKIENKSGKPLQNKELFSKYIFEAVSTGKPITFFNWECPPRRISYADGRPFVDYDVDLKKIFLGKKIDKYTELPRVVDRAEEEIKMLSFLKGLGFPFRFVKLIADTNLYFLTPDSLSIIGQKEVDEKFIEFKNLIEAEVKRYPVKTKTILFTTLFKPFIAMYKEIYEQSSALLNVNSNCVLSSEVLRAQLLRTEKHIGIINKKWMRDFSVRTIATYAAEGVVFEALSRTAGFSNCVWLNNHEVDGRTVEITNCYRRKMGIADLPMVLWGAGTPQ